MEDEESKDTFQNLANYKLSADWRYLRGFTDRQPEQYFEDFLRLPDGAVFADVGGYRGETSLEFVRRFPDYGGIHFFEPEAENMIRAKENLSGVPNIEFHACACSDHRGIIDFASDGSSSKIVSGGEGATGSIAIERFDNVV